MTCTPLIRLWVFAALCVGLSTPASAQLLWITGDVTPAARTAMVERLGADVGLAVQHLDYPLRGASNLDAKDQATLQIALTKAALVWVDAPHPTVQVRLKGLVGETLAAWAFTHPERTVWALSELKSDALTAGSAAAVTAAAPPARGTGSTERMAAYLQAGGERNLRPALALAKAVIESQQGKPLPSAADLPAALPWPARGVYHPLAPDLMADAAAFARWQATTPSLRGLPPVAVLVHRYHFVNGSTAWLDAWLKLFADQGLAAYAVFGQQVDAAGLTALLETPAPAKNGAPTLSIHPRAIVTHQLLSQGIALQTLFTRWGVPVLATQLYRQGDTATWAADENGLAQSDVPFYLAQPEAAGTIDPLLVVAQGPKGQQELIIAQAAAVAAKARRLITLQTKPAADKRLVAMVYNYPPGGSNFGASFLNVPRSLEQVSGALAQHGYTTQAIAEDQWVERLKPLIAAYYPATDLRALLANDQAAALPLARYQAWWATLPTSVRQRITAQWGEPQSSRYVIDWQGQKVFAIPRLAIGNLSVLPQPPREETLRQGQNPFMHRSKTPLSHHYLAVYLWAQQADALIHFGTHGTQEWAPGKARGLSVDDDALLPLGDIPVIYPYIVDNLGEALTAKRRGRAVLVSHKTPVFAPAGFESRMAHMHELMHEWETVDAGPTKQALEKQLVANFVEHQLHKDLGWTAERITANFAGFLELLHPYLDQLAQSSQPQGLAVFGRVPDTAMRRQTILQSLRKPLIEALGEDIDEAFLIDYKAVATARPARWLDVALRDAQAASVLDLRQERQEPRTDTSPSDAAKTTSAGVIPNRAALKPIDSPALFKLAERAQALEKLLATEGEIPGLLTALEGRFLPAAYGGDPIRNPDSLPTGRNLTGLDPSRLPTRQAYAVAQTLFKDWLKDWRSAHQGSTPSRMALSLWAGETLRHQGIMEAQALVAMGVRPVWDDAGRPIRTELIPMAELQRPRVDVLLSVTGSYRDQFPALMALIDQAVAVVTTAEDGDKGTAAGNAIARNTAQVASELRQRGLSAAQAQTLAGARVFGNGLGDYGTGVSDAVQSDGLRRDEPAGARAGASGAGGDAGNGGGSDARLGELILQRMSQPYVNGQALTGIPAAAAAQALGAHLRHTDAAVLSRSSNLYAMVTSDDPFQYLGGLAAAARSAGKKEALGLYVSQLQDVSEATTETAQRSIALEMQSRYLHPGWLQAQKAEGYSGTLQVLKAVQFAWGWQAVAPDTIRPDHWQSFFDVLVKDKHKLDLPQWMSTHPQAYAQALERLVQAQRLGYWEADKATQQQLATVYQDLTRTAPLNNELAAVRQWVVKAALGGALTLAAAPVAHAVRAGPANKRQAPRDLEPPAVPVLQGLLLQRQADPQAATVSMAWLMQALAWLAMASVALCGAAFQQRRMSFNADAFSANHTLAPA